MNTTDLTFNDLPEVVGELCERIAGMENLLRDTLNRQSEPKENLHGTLTRKLASRYSISALRNSYGKEDLMNIALSRRETPSRSPIFQAKCLKEGELIFASFVEWIG